MNYRYGFNGKEKDNEIKGDGNSLDFGTRIYDSRLGRWLSLDPMASKYAQESPYDFSFNSPLAFNDPDGKKPRIRWCTSTVTQKDGKTIITVHLQLEVKVAVINKSSTVMSKTEGEELAGTLNIESPEGSYSGSMDDEGFSALLFNVSNKADIVINYKVDISQSYRFIENVDAAKTDEELLILVDSHNPGLKAGGWAHSDYGAATADIGQVTNIKLKNKVVKGSTGVHEVGHLLGAADRYKRDKEFNVTDKGPSTTVMSAAPNKSIAFDDEDIQGMLKSALWDLAYDKQRAKLGVTTSIYKLVGETYVPQYRMTAEQRVSRAIQFSVQAPPPVKR